jgi:hypothetical protein
VDFLVQDGADVNAEDYYRRIALHWVAKYGGKATVRLLADEGANVNAPDHWGKTPLRWAIENGQTKTVRMLLKVGANVEARARFDVTALHIAAFVGCESSVRLLLERDANADIVASCCKPDDIFDLDIGTTNVTDDLLSDLMRCSCLQRGHRNIAGVEARCGFTAQQLAARGEYVAIQHLLESSSARHPKGQPKKQILHMNFHWSSSTSLRARIHLSLKYIPLT